MSQERGRREWRRLGQALIELLVAVAFLIAFVMLTDWWLGLAYQPYP